MLVEKRRNILERVTSKRSTLLNRWKTPTSLRTTMVLADLAYTWTCLADMAFMYSCWVGKSQLEKKGWRGREPAKQIDRTKRKMGVPSLRHASKVKFGHICATWAKKTRWFWARVKSERFWTWAVFFGLSKSW